MAVFDYIDSSILSPVYKNKLPKIKSPSIDRICRELYYTIKAEEPIFVYGDYDMDGFCCNKVWAEILPTLYNIPVTHFIYGSRTHNLDRDILNQVRNIPARIIIICDTGSSYEDREILSLLKMMGKTPIVIDHHKWQGDYQEDSKSFFAFNSFEERDLLGGHQISGAYASLLVGSILCEDWFQTPISYNACVYALASMYSDVVDLSTPPGRALYNLVCLGKSTMPVLLSSMNTWSYSCCKRLFSFIIGPKFNACFRTEQFRPLNNALRTNDRFSFKQIAEDFSQVHKDAQKLTNLFIPLFEKEDFGEVMLFTHQLVEETSAMHIRNFSGLVANILQKEYKKMVVVVIKGEDGYHGSFRDYYNRAMLSTFSLFCEAAGHPAAFGISFTNINELRRHLRKISTDMSDKVKKDYDLLSGTLIGSKEDIQVLALYNEYMNVRPRLLLNHHCEHIRTITSTKFKKVYDVGLPYLVSSSSPIREGTTILIEPTITKSTELRCVE